MDNESERFIQESLEELMGEHTCLIIAHRLFTIEKADKIIYLEDGSVVEEGTHEELMGNPDSKYRMLVERNLFWREERSKRDGAFCFTGTSSVPMLLNTPIGAL